jgi:hypothetical protein
MSDRLLVANAADPKQVKRGKQTERWRMEREENDLRAILDTLTGRRVVWKLLCDAGVFRAMYEMSEFERGVQEGKRRLGLELMTAIQRIDSTLYHRMAKEAHDLDQAYGPDKQDTVTTDPDTKETDDATD